MGISTILRVASAVSCCCSSMIFRFIIFCSLLSALTLNASESELSVVEIHGQQTYDLSPQEIPGSHERIQLDELSQSTLAISDVLNQQSGIQIRSLGGRGQFSYPSIRGASGKQLQLLWDGVPLSALNSMDGSLPIVGMSSLEAIDIYRGIAPVELAPTAIGGTINLRSRQFYEKTSEGSAYLSAGSFGYNAAGIWQALSAGDWRLFSALDYMQAENDFVISNSRDKRKNNAASHSTAMVRADYNGFSRWQPSLLIQHLQKKQEIADLRNLRDNGAYLTESTNNLTLLLRHHADSQQSSDLSLTLYHSDEFFNDQADNIGLGQQKNSYRTSGVISRLNYTINFRDGQYLATASVRSENSDSDYQLKSASTIQSDCSSGNDCPYSYTRSQYHLGNRLSYQASHYLLLNGQLSYLYFNDQQNADYGFSAEHSNAGYITADVGADIQFSASSLGLLLSRQVRPVSTQELFGDRGLTLGNPDLKAERSEGADITLNSLFAAGEWSLAGYYRIRHDAIVASADSRGVIRYDNLAATKHYGLEASIRLQLTSAVTFHGNSGWHQQQINDHLRPAFVGNRVPNQRTWDHYYAVQYRHKNWSGALAYTRQAGGFYESTNLLPIPLRSQADFWIGYTYQDLSLRFEANNLTNNRVSDFHHYPVPGRNFALKTSYRW